MTHTEEVEVVECDGCGTGEGVWMNFELFDRNKLPIVIYDKIVSNTCQFGHHFLVVDPHQQKELLLE